MIFWVCLVGAFVFAILTIVCITGATFCCKHAEAYGFAMFIAFITFIFTLVTSFATVGMWNSYADDYSVVVEQDRIIQVQKERIKSLQARLEKLQYPEKPSVSLDNDSPWATMIEQISDAEQQIAAAKVRRAEAIRAITNWKTGPFSGVVTFVGDPVDKQNQ